MKKPSGKLAPVTAGQHLTKAAPKKEVAVADTKSTAVAQVEDHGFGDFAGVGSENVGAKDILVPRLTLLQALSPQLNKKKPEYIEGGEIGDICDVGLGQLFKGSILFLPVLFRKEYLEWAPRASGKGLVNIHPDDSILRKTTENEKRQNFLPNGNQIIETAQFYGFNVTAGLRKSFIPMSVSNLKKARKWMTLATSEVLKRPDGSTFMPPLFYRLYELSSVEESNAEGDWAGWNVARGPALPEIPEGVIDIEWQTLRTMCMEFHKVLSAGEMRGDHSEPAEDTEVAGGEGRM